MSLEDQRNECFRKIGRNIYIYQQFEQLLKGILSMCTFGHTSNIVNEREKIKTSTLGQLITRAAKTSQKKIVEEPNSQEDFFNIDFGEHHPLLNISSYENQLQEVIAERNQLTHHLLEFFDINSSESCLQLDKKLDEQRKSAIEAIEKLRPIAKTLSNIQESLRQALQNDFVKASLTEHQTNMPISNTDAIDLICKASDSCTNSERWVSLSNLGRVLNKAEKEELFTFGKQLGLKNLKEILKATGLFEFREVKAKKGYQLQLRVNYH